MQVHDSARRLAASLMDLLKSLRKLPSSAQQLSRLVRPCCATCASGPTGCSSYLDWLAPVHVPCTARLQMSLAQESYARGCKPPLLKLLCRTCRARHASRPACSSFLAPQKLWSHCLSSLC